MQVFLAFENPLSDAAADSNAEKKHKQDDGKAVCAVVDQKLQTSRPDDFVGKSGKSC